MLKYQRPQKSSTPYFAAADDDKAGWERGFNETCAMAERERRNAEVRRLAQLAPIDFEFQ